MTELTLKSQRVQATVGCPPYRTRVLENGRSWIEYYRTSTGYILRFPELADFEISLDGQSVDCFPAPDVSEVAYFWIQHLYRYHVLPLALSKRGELVLHASAIEIHDGAVAFVARPNRLKLPLAECFAANGFRYIAHDGLVVRPDANGFGIFPSYPPLKGRQSALGPSSNLEEFDLASTDKPRPLRRMYFLGDGDASALEVTPLDAVETLTTLVRHVFLLDTEDSLAHQFDQLTGLANQGFHYRLDYPRFGDLTEVRQAILTNGL